MVIGAGQMGAGIAQVCAMAGHEVTLHDIKEEIIGKGVSVIQQKICRAVEKSSMTEAEAEDILQQICTSTHSHETAHVDLVIKAAEENMQTQTNIVRQLDELTPKHTILATNTTS